MQIRTFFIGLAFLLSTGVGAQTGLTVDTGLELGWWLHQIGAPERGVFKTHHTGSPFVQVSYQWPLRRWRLGLGVRGSLFLEDDMRGPTDSRRRAERLIISDIGFIPMLRAGVQVGYELLRRGNYVLVPSLQYGPFFFQTNHPDRGNFGYQHFTEILFTHVWKRPKRHWILRMNYNTQRIFLREKNHPNEGHQLFSWGIGVGLGF